MTKVLVNRDFQGRFLFILVTIWTVFSLYINTFKVTDGFVFGIYKLVFYLLSIVVITIIITQIKRITIVQLFFFLASLVPVFSYTSDNPELLLGERLRWLFYTATILVATPYNFNLWKKVSIALLFMNLLSLIFIPNLYFPTNEQWDFEVQRFPMALVLGGLFLFGFQKRLKKPEVILLYLSTIITIGIYLIYGRRTSTLQSILFIMIPLFVFGKDKMRNIMFVTISIIILTVSGWLYTNYVSNNLFTYFIERLDSDTRSEVDQLTIKALDSGNGWVLGLGVQGGYKNPIDHEKEKIRTMVETGALDVIMDGGLVLLISLYALFITGIYKGFSVKDETIRVFAVISLLYLVQQYPLVQPGIDIYGFIVFTSIGICTNKETFLDLKKKALLKLYFHRFKNISN